MEETTEKNFIPHNNFYKIVIVEAICITILILVITAVRYFSPATFKEIRDFYEQNFLIETNVDEVLQNYTQSEADEL